ncbi:MAG: GcrA family cell cycle regulator [Pseudomonadota bacterium]|nr:GcrA family cell cycle regulator [Pseudomonadota bacterium]
MSWTEQKIQMLKDMWGNGYSASEIAKRLGGMTRNAVIGKAHRLKLSSRPSPIRRDEDGALSVPGGSVMPTMKSTRKRVMLRPLPPVPMPSTAKGTVTRDFRSTIEPPKRVEGIAVTKAGDRHCRWPVGDPRSPDFRFCGCTAHEGLPYCVDHARVAYQNIGRRQRSNDGDSAIEHRPAATPRY